MQGKLLFFV